MDKGAFADDGAATAVVVGPACQMVWACYFNNDTQAPEESGWKLQKAGGRGPGGAVLHAVDCTEAPENALLLPLERALDVAEQPGTRLCSLLSAAQELVPVLRGFDHIDGG
ncbi:DUF6233 domain-containing protein [Streptomyces seoulensis]